MFLLCLQQYSTHATFAFDYLYIGVHKPTFLMSHHCIAMMCSHCICFTVRRNQLFFYFKQLLCWHGTLPILKRDCVCYSQYSVNHSQYFSCYFGTKYRFMCPLSICCIGFIYRLGVQMHETFAA